MEGGATRSAAFLHLIRHLLRVDHDFSGELSDVYHSIFSVPHGESPSKNVLHRVLN
jgi:hypothetical protein